MSDRFLGLPAADPRRPAAATVLGIPLATPYPGRMAHATGGPTAVRRASGSWAGFVGHHDFDTGRPFAAWWSRATDAGDVPVDPATPEANRDRVERHVGTLLASGSIPVVIGGDDSVCIPVLAGYREAGPVSVLQVDAHLDFRDEVDGERFGYSSPMRRISEMPWVTRIHHVGQRGVGSARADDLRDTLDAGNSVTTTPDLARHGIEPVIGAFAPGEPYVVVLDVDGLDPAQVPAVRAPSPGGPDLAVVVELLAATARRASCRGLVVTEFEPDLDAHGISARVVTKLICRTLDEALQEPSSTGP